ncbi:MAG: hypothetical protein ABIM89_17070 [Mycobacteriales bacterium]
MTSARVPAFVVAGSVAIAAGAATVHGAALAASYPLRTVSIARSGNLVSAVVSLPPVLSGRTVPAGAFSVRADGVVTPVRVTKLGAATTRLTVVLDVPAADAIVLTVVKGAVADFLVHLPADLAVAVRALDESAAPRPTTERAESLAALRDIRAQEHSATDGALSDVIAGAGGRPGERSVVVLLSARTSSPGPDVRAAPGGPLVYAVTPPGVSGSAAAVAAESSGGTSGQWTTGAGLLTLLDAVTVDLAAQYRLDFVHATTGPVDIVAEFAGTRTEARVVMPAATAAPTAAATAAQTAAAPAGKVASSVVAAASPSANAALSQQASGEDRNSGGALQLGGIALLMLFLTCLALIGDLAFPLAEAAGGRRARRRTQRFAPGELARPETQPDPEPAPADVEPAVYIEVPPFARVEDAATETAEAPVVIDLTGLPEGTETDGPPVTRPSVGPRMIDLRDYPNSDADTIPRHRKRR